MMRALLPLFHATRAVSLASIRPRSHTTLVKPTIALDLDGTVTTVSWLKQPPKSHQEALAVTKDHFISFIQDQHLAYHFYFVSCNQKDLILSYLKLLFAEKYQQYIQGIIASDGFLPLAQQSLTQKQRSMLQIIRPKLRDDGKLHHLLLLQHLSQSEPTKICLIDDRAKNLEEAKMLGMKTLTAEMAASPLLFEKLLRNAPGQLRSLNTTLKNTRRNPRQY